MKIRRKTKGILQLFRPDLSSAAGLCVIAGELIATGHTLQPHEAILGFLVGFFISSSALISNDYFDLESDKINAPARPLPSGTVTPTDILLLTILSTVIGFTAALLLNILALLVAILFWSIGIAYNWRLKETGLLGNILVSSSVAITFIFGGIATNQPGNTLVWFFSCIVFCIDLGEEIAADAMDQKGDTKRKSKSIALTKGTNTAIRIASTIFLFVVIISTIPVLLHWLGTPYLIMIALMDSIIIISTIQLHRNNNPTTQRRYLRAIYLGATLSLLAFIIGQLLIS
jgi:geranylgeranylglycerol-phosphate geranylgeranyltransferase